MVYTQRVNGYYFGWGLSILLFVCWVAVYLVKSSKVTLDKTSLKIKQTNFLLQTHEQEFEYSRIKEFVKFGFRTMTNNRYHSIFKIGFWTNEAKFVNFPPNIAETRGKVEKVMTDLEDFKTQNKLNFTVKNDKFEVEMPDFRKNSFKNALQIVALILIYFCLPFATVAIFNLFI